MKKDILKAVKSTVVKNSPAILIGIGVAGFISTTILAVRATPKAMKLMDERKKELFLGKTDKLPPMEVVKATWKCYIPAAVTAGASIACVVGGASISNRRNIALAAAYSLSETALKDYQDKTLEVVGEKKEREIRDEVAKEVLARNEDREIIITGDGDHLCLETSSQRLFKSNINKVQKVENILNRRLMSEMNISLNEYYDELGLDRVDPKIGDSIGWNVSKGMISLDTSSQLTKDGTPCLVITISPGPTYDFKALY